MTTIALGGSTGLVAAAPIGTWIDGNAVTVTTAPAQTATIETPSNTMVGDLIILAVTWYTVGIQYGASLVTSCVDTQGTTWANGPSNPYGPQGPFTSSSVNTMLDVYWTYATQNGPFSVTLNWGPGANNKVLVFLHHYRGYGAYDIFGGSGITGATGASQHLATTTAQDLVFAATADGNNISYGAPMLTRIYTSPNQDVMTADCLDAGAAWENFPFNQWFNVVINTPHAGSGVGGGFFVHTFSPIPPKTIDVPVGMVGMTNMTVQPVGANSPVMMQLQGGPLDGEFQIVEMLPTTPGAELVFNVPHYQTFDPNQTDVVLSQGLQAVYSLVGQGPGVPGPADNWVTEWVFAFTGEAYIPTPAPLPPAPPQPDVAVHVGMQATTTLTPDTMPVTSQPVVTMSAESLIDVEADSIESGVVAMTAETVMTIQPDWTPLVTMGDSATSMSVTPDPDNPLAMSATAGLALQIQDGWSLYLAAVTASAPDQLFWPLDVMPSDATMYGTIAFSGAVDPWGAHHAAFFNGQLASGGYSSLVQNIPQWTRSGAFTMECWVQSTYYAEAFFEFNASPPTNGNPTGTGYGPSFAITVPASIANLSAGAVMGSLGLNSLPVQVGDGGWHHIAWTYDGNQGYAFYCDGAQKTITSAAAQNVFLGSWRVGRGAYGGNANPFQGNLCFMSVWSRALPFSEILGHYNAVPPLPSSALYRSAVLASNPDLFWRLNVPPDRATVVGTTPALTFGSQDPWGTTDAVLGGGTVSGQHIVNNAQETIPGSFAMECWFQTTQPEGLLDFLPEGPGVANPAENPSNNAARSATFGLWSGTGMAYLFGSTAAGIAGVGEQSADNTWYHTVYTYNGQTGIASIYRNGVLRANQNLSASLPLPVVMGYWRGGYSNRQWARLMGSMSHLAVYYRWMPPAEVAMHYNVGRGIPQTSVVLNAKAGLGVATTWSTYAAAVMASAPTAYWRLNESAGSLTAADSMASGRTGNVSGTVTFGGPDPWGTAPGSVHLDGTGGQIISALSETTSGSFTIECWVRTSLAAQQTAVEFNAGSAAAPTGTYNVAWGIHSTGVLRQVIPPRGNSGLGPTVSDGNWHHVVLTYAEGNGGVITVFSDGVQVAPIVANNPYPPGRSTVTGYWRIGRGVALQNLTGDVAHVAVYNRVLALAEIKSHFLSHP